MSGTITEQIARIGEPNEQKVAKFLHSIGFDFVKAGFELKNDKNKPIAEIDLVFKFDNYLLLVEVNGDKSAGRRKKFTFFTQWETSEYLEKIRATFNASHKKIVKIYFDLTLKTFKEESDSMFPFLSDNKLNRIAYDEDFDYFVNCVKKIGKWARNDFLDWLEIPDQKKTKDVEAIQYYIGDTPAFCFVERVDALLQSCYISRRRRSEPDLGYQRTLNEKRMLNIQDNIQKREGLTFPNSILIYAPKLTDNILPKHECPQRVTIHFPTSYCSCRIIDGQHRLMGFSNTSEDIIEQSYLPVIALPEIDKTKEFKTFIDINSKQQKMDNNLILHLKSDFEWPKESKEYQEKIGVKVAEKLNEKIFKNRIYFGTADEPKGNKITLVTLVSALKNSNQIKDSVEQTFESVSEVFSYIGEYMHNHLKPDGYFGQNRGIRVLFRLVHLFQRNHNASKISVDLRTFVKDLSTILDRKMIENLNEFYGEGGATAAAKALITSLRKKHSQRYGTMQSDLKGI